MSTFPLARPANNPFWFSLVGSGILTYKVNIRLPAMTEVPLASVVKSAKKSEVVLRCGPAGEKEGYTVTAFEVEFEAPLPVCDRSEVLEIEGQLCQQIERAGVGARSALFVPVDAVRGHAES